MPNIPSFQDAKQAIKDRIPENIKERIPSNVDEFVEKIPYAKQVNKVAEKLPKVIGPKAHAIIDFAVASSFLTMGALWLGSNKRAAIASFICGGAALTNSLLTDYPGGVADVISFETHGKIDVGLAAATALMPKLLGFSDEGRAWFFRAQSGAETVVVGLTDFGSGTREGEIEAAA
jgi:hypothetical protein